MPIDSQTIVRLLPELLLVLLAVIVLIGGTIIRSKIVWTSLSMAVLVGVLVGVYQQPLAEMGSGPVLADFLARGFRLCSVLIAILYLAFLFQSRQTRIYPELVGSILMMFVGLMLVSSAGDLIILFLGLELISIPTYILLFIGKPDRGSEESAAKYFFLSVLSSAFLLYGFATLYGLSGEIEFAAIEASLNGATDRVMWPLLPVAMIMILAGLAFKISAFPFHFYAPDVFQGTTNFNAAVLAVVPKMAGVVGLVRLLVAAFPRESTVLWQLVIILAVITMTVGNFAALWQQNIKRLMAYSSIAHGGYLLIGLAAALGTGIGSRHGEDAVAAMVFYVVAYAAASLGTFAGIAYLSDDDESFSNVEDLAGIGRGYPVIALCLAICMFSLAGIPPLAGFWGKFALFKSALDVGFIGPELPRAWFVTLSVIGALNAAAAAGYYLRIVATMYFRSSVDHSLMPVMGNLGAGAALMTSAIVIVGVGLFTGQPMASAQRAAEQVWYAAKSDAVVEASPLLPSASKQGVHELH